MGAAPVPVPGQPGADPEGQVPERDVLDAWRTFEKELDKAFRRKNIPVWITEYGNETKPGEPKGVTESQQASYLPQAIALAKKDPRIPMFIWFVMQDSQGSPWQSGIYRDDRRAQARAAAVRDRRAARSAR